MNAGMWVWFGPHASIIIKEVLKLLFQFHNTKFGKHGQHKKNILKNGRNIWLSSIQIYIPLKVQKQDIQYKLRLYISLKRAETR